MPKRPRPPAKPKSEWRPAIRIDPRTNKRVSPIRDHPALNLMQKDLMRMGQMLPSGQKVGYDYLVSAYGSGTPPPAWQGSKNVPWEVFAFSKQAIQAYVKGSFRPEMEIALKAKDESARLHLRTLHDETWEEIRWGMEAARGRKKIVKDAKTGVERELLDPDFSAHQGYINNALCLTDRLQQDLFRQEDREAGIGPGGPGGAAGGGVYISIDQCVGMPLSPFVIDEMERDRELARESGQSVPPTIELTRVAKHKLRVLDEEEREVHLDSVDPT